MPAATHSTTSYGNKKAADPKTSGLFINNQLITNH